MVQHWSRRCAPVLLVCVATARPAAAMCCRPSARRAQRSHEPDAWDGMPLAPEPRDDPVAGSGDGARLVRWVRSQQPQDHELPRPSVCSRLLIVARRAGGARQWALGPTRAIRPSVETDLRRTDSTTRQLRGLVTALCFSLIRNSTLMLCAPRSVRSTDVLSPVRAACTMYLYVLPAIYIETLILSV